MADINLEDGTPNPPVDFNPLDEIGPNSNSSENDSAAEQAIAANLARLQGLPQAALPTAGTGSLRYPNKDINENGDYVLFNFKKYQAPFGNRTKIDVEGGNGKVFDLSLIHI